jgi:hypothetical protein
MSKSGGCQLVATAFFVFQKSVNDVTFLKNYIAYIRSLNFTFRQYNFTLVYQELSIS